MLNARLEQQFAFLREIDKLKSIFRKTLLLDGSRAESDPEHSWELSVMAMVVAKCKPDVAGGSQVLWNFLQEKIDEAVESGILPRS